MGSVFRKTAVRDVPVGAKVVTNPDGTDEAKWVPRGSRRPITALVVTLDGGRRVVEVPTGCWYAKYRDADGIVRTVSTRCRDENNAKQVLARLERDAERIRSGVMTRREADAADQRRSPIAQHIEGYIARLPGKRGGTATAMHRDNTRRYLTRLAAECLWECLADMTRDSLERWITSHSRPGPDGRPVRSARSINCHRAAAVAFANWCADPLIGRLPSNPFGTGQYGVPKADEDADPRRRRRAFSPDELFHLVDAAYNAPERRTAKRCEENDRLAPATRRPPLRTR